MILLEEVAAMTFINKEFKKSFNHVQIRCPKVALILKVANWNSPVTSAYDTSLLYGRLQPPANISASMYSTTCKAVAKYMYR